MSGRRRTVQWQALGRCTMDGLSGRLGIVLMTAMYGVIAVLLLGYVSMQVYTNSLMEDVAKAEAERRGAMERVAIMMRDYTALASRENVSRYCEEKLGMIEGDASRVLRVVVEDPDAPRKDGRRRAVHPVNAVGPDLVDISGVLRR